MRCSPGCSTSRAEVLALGKRAFYRQLEMGLEDAYAFTTDVIVDNALGKDFEEGLAAFVEKRAPGVARPERRARGQLTETNPKAAHRPALRRRLSSAASSSGSRRSPRSA